MVIKCLYIFSYEGDFVLQRQYLLEEIMKLIKPYREVLPNLFFFCSLIRREMFSDIDITI